jgi:glycosyltransferase involved in cell wall biosynthesis
MWNGAVVKICVAGLRGVPGVMGGVETHCESLYPRIAARAPDLDITIYGRAPYVGKRPYSFGDLRVAPLASPRHVGLEAIVHTLLAVLHARFVRRADLLHLHAIGPGLLAPLARLLGLRVVATHHGADYERQKWGGFAKRMLRLGETAMLRNSNAVIVVGRSAAEALRARFPARAERIHFVPNGAELPPPDPEAHPLEALGLEPGAYVLAVGRLVPEKGFEDLIAAHERSGSRRKLVIVGDADHASAFSAALRARASERVLFAGRLPRATLATLYREAAAFVLPSYHEGHPIAALEALSAGAPVVLSDIAPNRDIGLPSDRYFPLGDVAALAEILARDDFPALRPEEVALLDRYRWDDIARRTVEIMREAAR